MTLRDDYVAAVEAENEQLRERVQQLEELLGLSFESPPILGLTQREGALFGLLLSREFLTKEAIMVGLYGLMPGADEVEIQIVDVFTCKLRKKLKPFGIAIETSWGRGYYMTAEAKAAAKALMPKPRVTEISPSRIEAVQ
jgi:two-component system, cell cycle response regulator CtrA